MDTAVAGLVFAAVAQFAGLIWGASKLSASVSSLQKAVEKLDQSTRHLEGALGGLDRRVAVLEDRSIRRDK